MNKFITLVLFFAFTTVYAQLKLPSVFGDHMVLQQNEKIVIWGTDQPNTLITVTSSWGVSSQTTANVDGFWETKIATPKASFEPQTLTIVGTTQKSYSNILIGEVWFCSGQSNMEMPLKGFNNNPVKNADFYIDRSINKNIRLFNNDKEASLEPLFETNGIWVESTKNDAQEFSAIGYMFALQLYNKLNVPIGIIESSWGGTPIETWLTKKSAEKYPEIKLPKSLPEDLNKQKLPTALYNAMIHPFKNFTIKGVLWYQGEANVPKPSTYKNYLHELVTGWREQWQNKTLPFYLVQITPYAYHKYRNRPELNSDIIKEAQLQFAKEMPHTGIVITTDVGSCSNIHPSKKEPIAERLLAYALAEQYQFKKQNYKSPTYSSMKIEGTKVILSFNFDKSNKKSIGFKKDNTINGFKIAGDDRQFYPAKISFNNKNQIIVECEKVSKPVAVRYGFEDCFEGTLVGKNRLPVSVFRTDNWE